MATARTDDGIEVQWTSSSVGAEALDTALNRGTYELLEADEQRPVCFTTTQISSSGTAQIVVHTPANLSGDLGCDSGGNSQALTFTVT